MTPIPTDEITTLKGTKTISQINIVTTKLVVMWRIPKIRDAFFLSVIATLKISMTHLWQPSSGRHNYQLRQITNPG